MYIFQRKFCKAQQVYIKEILLANKSQSTGNGVYPEIKCQYLETTNKVQYFIYSHRGMIKKLSILRDHHGGRKA